MPTVPDRHPVTRALCAMLATVTGLPAGDGEAPFDDTERPTYPYLVVDAILGGSSWPDAGTPDATLEWVWQVTAVGERRDQADAAADRARRAILERSPGVAGSTPASFTNAVTVTLSGPETAAGMVAGRVVHRRIDASGGTSREGRVFNAVDRYALTVSVA